MAASPGLASGKFLLSLGTRTVKVLNVSVLLAYLSLPKGSYVCSSWLPWSGADERDSP